MAKSINQMRIVHPNLNNLDDFNAATAVTHAASITTLPWHSRSNIGGGYTPTAQGPLSTYEMSLMYFDTAVLACQWDASNTTNATATYNQPRIMNLSTMPGNPQGIRTSYTPNSTANSGWGLVYAKKMVSGSLGAEQNIARTRAYFTGRYTSWGAWYGSNTIRTIYVDVLVANSCYPDWGQYNHTRLGVGTGSTNSSGVKSWTTSTANPNANIIIKNRW